MGLASLREDALVKLVLYRELSDAAQTFTMLPDRVSRYKDRVCERFCVASIGRSLYGFWVASLVNYLGLGLGRCDRSDRGPCRRVVIHRSVTKL